MGDVIQIVLVGYIIVLMSSHIIQIVLMTQAVLIVAQPPLHAELMFC